MSRQLLRAILTLPKGGQEFEVGDEGSSKGTSVELDGPFIEKL